MKTFLAISITAVITWIITTVSHGARTGTDRLWMVSAVKAPGRMALADIQADMDARRYSVAKAKIDSFMTTWQRFETGPDSCSGLGIGDIMVTFSKIPNVDGAGTTATRPVSSMSFRQQNTVIAVASAAASGCA